VRTRREWLKTMAALGAGALLPRSLAARAMQHPVQDPTAALRAQIGAVPIRTQQLGENLTLLSGPGGNVVLLHGADGLVVIDTFVAPAWPKLDESLKALGAPVKFVINTHWHFDHTDNNAPLHAAGATVVAHENTKRRMSEPHHLPMLELDFPPSPQAALPQRVFADVYRLETSREQLQLVHMAPAHTDTDVIVRFERSNVLHAGDVFFNGRYPLIDWSTGGRVDGMIAAANRLLDLAAADTKIVPGHGPLGTKAMIRDYRQMLVDVRERIQKLKAAGKSEDEVVAAKPNADYDAKFRVDERARGNFIRVVYRSLKN